MADNLQWATDLFAQVEAFLQAADNLRILKDRADQDSTLVTNYISNPVHRADLTADEINAALAAIGQLLFALDSGSPPTKKSLYELL